MDNSPCPYVVHLRAALPARCARPSAMAPPRQAAHDQPHAAGGAENAKASPGRQAPARGARMKKGAGTKAAPRARSMLADDSEEDVGGASQGDEEDGDGLADTRAAAEEPLSIWALKGSLAGRLATDKARKNEDYAVEAPPAVVAAGEEAEFAWLTAFSKAFQPVTASPVRDDRRLSGLTIPKRRRLSAKPEPNKKGRAGLDESAEAVVSTAVYAWVRNDFFLPADHLCAHIRACVKEEGFDAGDAEFEAWWEAKGHSLALAKAKTARHSTVEAVKCGVWLAHGASRHARIRHGLTLARSWHKGPTHTRAGGGLRQEAQGVRRFAGGRRDRTCRHTSVEHHHR